MSEHVSGATGGGARGHRTVDHTADMTLEVWAPDRAGCLEEAVHALVGSFATVDDARPVEDDERLLAASTGPDLLIELLGEVVYLLDAREQLPVSVTVCEEPRGVVARFELVPAGRAIITGALPKAVTYHRVRFGRDADGTWRARVTIDV